MNEAVLDRLVDSARGRASDWDDVLRRADMRPESGNRRLRARRGVLIALAAVVALLVPALALSDKLADFFAFTNKGEPVAQASLSLDAATSLEITGAAGDVVVLASRDGVGVYQAAGANGEKCFYVGPPDGHLNRGLSGGCMSRANSSGFPSPAQPIINMTGFKARKGVPGETVLQLAGVAADGVARVQVIGADCQVLAEALVIDNVFVNTSIPNERAVGIIARGHSGERVYLQEMRGWEQAQCPPTEQFARLVP